MADVYVNKVGAAERLISAAIDMAAMGCDPLATFVVAASARKSLSEIKAKRGGEHVQDLHRCGFFYMARDLRLGRLSLHELEAMGLSEVVCEVADAIERGEVFGPEDLTFTGIPTDRLYWNGKNRPFNYLKHADRDTEGLLDVTDIDVDWTIREAAALFRQLSGRANDKMLFYSKG